MKKKTRSTLKDHNQEQKKSNNHKEEQIKQQQPKFTLYLLLQVQKNASNQEIKKQYKKLVLKYHPDKNQQDPTARQKFQKLKEAFDILSDPQKRKIYDQTGTLDSQQKFDEAGFQAAYNYFRAMYKPIEQADIQQFSKRYRFGKEQQQDLIQYYTSHKGDMKALLESIPLSTNDDIPRFIKFYQKAIQEKILPKQNNFDKTKKKVRLLKDQTQQFQQMKKLQKNQNSLDSLALMIQKKNQGNLNFIQALQEKYGGGKKSKTDKPNPNKKKK